MFLSSSDIYRGSNKLVYKEEVQGLPMYDHPRSAYIEGKKIGESFVNLFSNKGIESKSARVTSTYGPGTRKNDARV